MITLRIIALTAAALLTTAGCSMKPKLVGSWNGKGTIAERPFEFSSMTLASDGTYTAIAKYADTERALTGHWKIENDVLFLDGGTRSYQFAFEGDNKVMFTDTAINETIKMSRVE
tara:strand:- start:2817 stop:3161 length:345 start_codon:yes stop_codon:yes gene_type:complete